MDADAQLMGSKRELAVFLSGLAVFEKPNPQLEQYPTDGDTAAAMLWDAMLHGDVTGKRVVDLGCGTGILGMGALALGAAHVSFVDVDSHCLVALRNNLLALEACVDRHFENYEFLMIDVDAVAGSFDTVIQNPPFGARTAHADIRFLQKATSLAPVIYSFHKSSTEDYLMRWAQQRGLHPTTIIACRFPLRNTLPEHRRAVHRIDVSCIRFKISPGE